MAAKTKQSVTEAEEQDALEALMGDASPKPVKNELEKAVDEAHETLDRRPIAELPEKIKTDRLDVYVSAEIDSPFVLAHWITNRAYVRTKRTWMSHGRWGAVEWGNIALTFEPKFFKETGK